MRAVHLECAPGLSSANFLACLRRFVAHRGCPDQIVCDNAPQFKLARTTLERQWDYRVTSFAASRNITWDFITEHAPWQGGFYERLIGLCKRALRKTINRRLLPLAELHTIIPEVEAALNSRPLTHVDEELDGGVTITPAHFLNASHTPQLSLPAASHLHTTGDAQLYLPSTDPAEDLRRAWQDGMSTLDYFWIIWETDYLQLLRQQSISRRHHQHSTTDRTPKVGEVVIVKIEGQPRATWQLGRVTDVVRSHDNLVRSARVLMPNKRILTRPVNLLYPLELHGINVKDRPCSPTPGPSPVVTRRRICSAAAEAQRRLGLLTELI